MSDQAFGVAWREPTKGKEGKFHYNVRLDMGGMILPIPCRIVENTPDPKREGKKPPQYLMFFTPQGEEKGRKVGAFWERTTKEAGTIYLSGEIEIQHLGIVRHPGGAVTDFSLAGKPVEAKLAEFKERRGNGKGPTHLLMPWTHKRRSSTGEGDQEAASAQEAEVIGAEELEEQEA